MMTLAAGVLSATLAVSTQADDFNKVKKGDSGAVTAVGLIGQWIEAGAPNADFMYSDIHGDKFMANFDEDVLTLFTQSGKWFKNQQACSTCHFNNTENSFHEMDLTSHEGLMRGGDFLSKPPGVPLFGEKKIGDTKYNWDKSKMKARMRNNRMPPGWQFDISEANRDGPCVSVGEDGVKLVREGHSLKYGCDHNAVGLLEAWVEAGALQHKAFPYGGGMADFDRDVLPFFTASGMWFDNSQSCSSCHFGNTENSFHEMDLRSYAGIMRGGDVLSKPPGVPLLGESKIGAKDYNWGKSKMNERLRDNRMPPGITFDITEENRDGPLLNPVAEEVTWFNK